MRSKSPSVSVSGGWFVKPAARQTVWPSRVCSVPVSSCAVSESPARCRARSHAAVSASVQPERKSSERRSPSPPVAAARDSSKTAGPLTPYSVN